MVEGRTFKLLPGVVTILHGTTIKVKDGEMVVLQVENLHSGWDAENNITHEFSEELCNTLDELVDARACGTETAQLENIVCEAGECNCCWLGVNGEVMFAPQRWRQTTTCVMLTWQKPKALPSTAPCHPCCNTESWRSGRLLGMGHQHKQSCTQSPVQVVHRQGPVRQQMVLMVLVTVQACLQMSLGPVIIAALSTQQSRAARCAGGGRRLPRVPQLGVPGQLFDLGPLELPSGFRMPRHTRH